MFLVKLCYFLLFDFILALLHVSALRLLLSGLQAVKHSQSLNNEKCKRKSASRHHLYHTFMGCSCPRYDPNQVTDLYLRAANTEAGNLFEMQKWRGLLVVPPSVPSEVSLCWLQEFLWQYWSLHHHWHKDVSRQKTEYGYYYYHWYRSVVIFLVKSANQTVLRQYIWLILILDFPETWMLSLQVQRRHFGSSCEFI